MEKAKDIMSSPCHTIQYNAVVKDIVNKILKTDLTALPVVDDQNKLMGIITTKDYLNFRGKKILPRHAEQYTKIEDIMTKDVIYVEEDDSVKKVCEILIKNKKHHVPVVRDGRAIGMISTTDLMNTLVKLMNGNL